MNSFNPPLDPQNIARGLSVLDDVAADRSADAILVSYAFDVDLTDIVWMLSQVAPDLEEELRTLLLAKLPTGLLDAKIEDIPHNVRTNIEVWRQAYLQRPYSTDERVRKVLRDSGANEV